MSEIRNENHLEKNRLEALTDGVFAIAMTLLVIDMKTPLNIQAGEEWSFLRGLLPDLLHYVLTFFLLGSFWHINYKMFFRIRKTDAAHVWINIFFLMGISLFPFTISTLTKYENSFALDSLFHCNVLFVGLLSCLSWRYASHNRRLLHEDVSEKDIRLQRLRGFVGPGVAICALAMALINPGRSSLPYAMIPLIVAFINRHAGNVSEPTLPLA